MSGSRFVSPYFTWDYPSGEPIPGSLLGFFISGSTTPAPTYSDVNLTVPNTNPVVADGNGVFPSIFLSPAATYKVVLSYPSDGINPPVQIWTADPVNGAVLLGGGVVLQSIADLEAASIASDVPSVQLLGYSAGGDGGAAVYVRSTGPAAIGKVQSADGAWWTLAEPFVNGQMFGAQGDGATDDTTALQNAIAYTVSNNVTLRLGGGTYLVTNITFPHNAVYDFNPAPYWQSLPRIVGDPGATIKKMAGGDNTYLAASDRWSTNVGFPTSPMWIEGVTFDGAGLAANVFVSVAFNSIVRNCVFTGGTQYGVYEPVTTENGTAIVGGRSSSTYEKNQIFGNGALGLAVDVLAGSAVISDYWLVDNLIYDNGPGNAGINQISGWIIRGNHCYWFNRPPASGNWSVFLGDGVASSISGNIWEGYAGGWAGLEISGGASGPVTIENDQFETGAGCVATFNGGACNLIRVRNCKFFGATALEHAQSNAACELVSENNTFVNTSPYVFSSGPSHAGVLTALNDRIGSNQDVYYGRQFSDSYSVQTRPGVIYPAAFPYQVTNVDQNVIRVTGVLAADEVIKMPAMPLRAMAYRVIRSTSATGAFNLNIQTGAGSLIIALDTAGTYADVEYDGQNWIYTATGNAQ